MKKNFVSAILLCACLLGAEQCPKIEPVQTSYGDYLKVFSHGNITINNLEINRGSCGYNKSFFKHSGLELKLGEKIIISVKCSVEEIKEIKIETNLGDCLISNYI